MRLSIICESAEDLQQRLEREFDLEQLWITEGPDYVELHNIRVKPGERNAGVGTKVVDAVKDYAANAGKRVILFAEPDRGKKTALSRFYKRLGFQKPGRRKDFSLPRHSHIWHSK